MDPACRNYRVAGKGESVRANPMMVSGLLLMAAVAAAPASAQFHFGVSAGMYEPERGTGSPTFSVRGGYRVRPKVGFEWSFSRVEVEETVDAATLPFDYDLFNLTTDLTDFDLSVQWFPGNGNFVVFGGPGISMIDSRVNVIFIGVPFTDSDITNIFTL